MTAKCTDYSTIDDDHFKWWVLALALYMGCLPERTTLRAAGATPRPVLSSPERRRAGETNMHACMNIQKHTVLAKSGEARSVLRDVSHRSPETSPQARRASWSAAPPRLSCPTLLRPVLSRIGDSELGLTRPALGADYYLTSLTSVMHREDRLHAARIRLHAGG